MFSSLYKVVAVTIGAAGIASASPVVEAPENAARAPSHAYDIHAHRGGRGNTVESTLPSFAWGLINGAKTLELDNGITKDGVVVVWHDENIVTEKCQDTGPAFPDDPSYPYVGKYIANLTWSQLKTLDCGSKRLVDYPQQLTYPRTRISTLSELFKFVSCADPEHKVLFNIESKIDAQYPNLTLGVNDFAKKQHAIFESTPYRDSITYQSFDWRTLLAMKQLKPSNRPLSALIDANTYYGPGNTTSAWLAGIRLDQYGKDVSVGVQIARAADSLGFDLVSPAASANGTDPTVPGWQWFTTKEMVSEAHRLGLQVKPWTVNRLSVVEQLYNFGVDGIITDYPDVVRRWALQNQIPVAPKYDEDRVMTCLAKALRAQRF